MRPRRLDDADIILKVPHDEISTSEIVLGSRPRFKGDLPICSRPPYHLATEPSIMLIMQFPRDMYPVL